MISTAIALVVYVLYPAGRPGSPGSASRTPLFMVFTIVASGNHFVFDAAAGGIVTASGVMVGRRLAEPRSSARAPVAVAGAPS